MNLTCSFLLKIESVSYTFTPSFLCVVGKWALVVSCDSYECLLVDSNLYSTGHKFSNNYFVSAWCDVTNTRKTLLCWTVHNYLYDTPFWGPTMSFALRSYFVTLFRGKFLLGKHILFVAKDFQRLPSNRLHRELGWAVHWVSKGLRRGWVYITVIE